MSHAIRSLAIAAAVAALAPMAAQASLLSPTVSSFNLQYSSGKITSNGTEYAQGVITTLGNGIGITGASVFLFEDNSVNPTIQLPVLTFSAGSTDITLDFSKSGLKINAITMFVISQGDLTTDLGQTFGANPQLPAAKWELQGACAGTLPCEDSRILTSTVDGFLDHITFSRANVGDAYLLNGLAFIDYSNPTSNNVPEPAGYGLAALALLAAGAASRRRAG